MHKKYHKINLPIVTPRPNYLKVKNSKNRMQRSKLKSSADFSNKT
jgi:hypothetical protein